jgi:uncharacterized membrane protein YcfT
LAGLGGDFALMLVQPFAMMWFLEMLAIFALVTRLTRAVPVWAMLAAGAALHALHYTSEWELVQQFGSRFVFFYAGYALAPQIFRLADWADRHRGAAVGALLGWAVVNGALVYYEFAGWRGISLVLGFAGAGAVVVLARLLCVLPWMDWLRYLGEHSLVVYLGFYLPMSAGTQILARKRDWVFDFGTFALALTAGSILCALVSYWVVRGTPARVLFARPAWARLTPPRPANALAPAAETPAA